MSRTSRSFFASASVVFALALAGVATWAFFNRSYVVDQAAVWQYSPTSEIEALAIESDMNETGKFYFYASHPKLHESQDTFNGACPRQEKSSAILGCYASGRIHVYDVKDPRLEAVPAVTAAHEMLHAAWDRMSESERQAFGKLLVDEYNRQKEAGDSELVTRMDYYERTAPDHLENELHSIIATEVEDISPELEDHYKAYFKDRQKVIDLYQSYNDRFVKLNNSTDTLRQELEQLSAEITAMTEQYNSDVDTLNNDILAFNARAESGYYQDQASFSNDRNQLTTRSSELQETRNAIDVKAGEYESKRVVYNEQVNESNSLLQALDSTTLAPTPDV